MVKANTLCGYVINELYDEVYQCIDVQCINCPVRNTYKSSGEHFTTQMSLTMEAVNHETRNPTSD